MVNRLPLAIAAGLALALTCSLAIGGGACSTGYTCGAGGNGAPGLVIVITTF